ncbi:MAG: hypothetical protein IJW59_04505 [Clostridia bacterium]|nr:hypothetical protein [Clostridia bacterium]
MKLNNKLNYVSKFKYFMIIPIVIVLASIVIGAIFNLNFDYDFRKVDNFSVKFNTTVTESEYDALEESISGILDKQGFKQYRLERIGSGAQNAILVKIPNDNGSFDSAIDEVKVIIEDKLLSVTDSISTSVVVTTSETGYSHPKNVTNLILYSTLSIVCIILFMFLYNVIRYNLASAYSIALSILLEVAMLFSSMVLFRIPFNYYFVVPFIVMITTTIINTTYINNYIKNTLTLDSYAKTTNSSRVEEATCKTFKLISCYTLMIMAVVLSVMFFGGPSLIYLGLAIVVGLIISAFVSLFFNTSLWSFWYRKDKDSVLKRRILAEQKKQDIKDGKAKPVDDKIVV